jgi:hypothetical protein
MLSPGRHCIEPRCGRSEQRDVFPQRGHGSIDLREIFNDPLELE